MRDSRPTRMKKPERIYKPRIFQGRVMEQEDFEKLHEELLLFARIGPVTNEMRKLIEETWPEFVDKLPPKRTRL